MNVAILGGTGKEGAGLAARWARAGHAIVIGSRDTERASAKAAELRQLTGRESITGESNAEAARRGQVVVVALPAEGLARTLPELRDGCRDKVVISTVVPLTFGGGRLFTPPPAGSAAEEVQDLLPHAKVVAAFHHIAAHELSANATPNRMRSPLVRRRPCGQASRDRAGRLDGTTQPRCRTPHQRRSAGGHHRRPRHH